MKRRYTLCKITAFLLSCLALGLISGIAFGQVTSISATVTDADSTVWVNGTYKLVFNPSPSQPNLFPPVRVYSGSLNGSGSFSTSVPDNNYIAVGSTYTITICPWASAPCSVLAPIAIMGSSYNLTSYIDNYITAPRFAASGSNQYGYADVEIYPTPLPGGQYYNVVSNVFRYWNGSTFVNAGGTASFPTAAIVGSGLYATNPPGQNYQAANINKVPVEFYGATAYTSEAAAEAGPDDTAKFQSAITALTYGAATCQAGMWYHVEGPVNFSSHEALIGNSQETYGGLCNLVTNSATSAVLTAIGTSGSYLTGVTIKNLGIYRSVAGTGTSAGIYASFSGGMIVDNILSDDSIYDVYRHATPSFGIGYFQHIQGGWLLGETSGTYYAVYDDSADGNAMNSALLLHSAAACQNLGTGATGYGYATVGEALNDNIVDDMNTAGCSYGKWADYTGSGGGIATSDIHWLGGTDDAFRVKGLLVQNLSTSTTGSLEISGGWEQTNYSSANTEAIDIENSVGVSINHQIIGSHGNASSPLAAGIYIHNSKVSATGNTILNVPTGFNIDNSNSSTFTGNNISSNFQQGVSAFSLINGSSYDAFNGNAIYNYINGIALNSGSGNNAGFFTNTFNTVTNQISDSSGATTNQLNRLQNLIIYGPNATVVAPSTTQVSQDTTSNFFELHAFGANTTTIPDVYIMGRNSTESINAQYLYCTYNSGNIHCTMPATFFPSISGTGTPTVAVGTAAGTGGTAVFNTGYTSDSIEGVVTLTTGTSTTTGTLFTVTFPNTRTKAPVCMVQLASATGGQNSTFVQSATTTVLTVSATTALTASSTYAALYLCGGN